MLADVFTGLNACGVFFNVDLYDLLYAVYVLNLNVYRYYFNVFNQFDEIEKCSF